MTRQRGSVVVYLLFSIALSIGAGYAVYILIRDHKPAEAATTQEAAPAPTPAPRPVAQPPQPAPTPVVEEPPAPMSVAEQRAVSPIVDPNYSSSPIMGVPGIDGGISRGSVDRRMRAHAVELQHCWEDAGDSPKTIRVTIHIDAAGRVSGATASPGLSPNAEACVLAIFSALSFSAPGKPAEVVQPIAFR